MLIEFDPGIQEYFWYATLASFRKWKNFGRREFGKASQGMFFLAKATKLNSVTKISKLNNSMQDTVSVCFKNFRC